MLKYSLLYPIYYELTKLYDQSKVEKVIELYKQRKTRREIAKIVHMSLGDIGVIINKYIENEEIQKKQFNGPCYFRRNQSYGTFF